MSKKMFRTAYVVQATNYDFAPLLEKCEEIKFVTTGYEKDDNLQVSIGMALVDYDPVNDVIVPVGNVANNVMVGIVAEQLRSYTHTNRINLALYRDKVYDIFTLTLRNLDTVIATKGGTRV